jgi:hypothetical protein
MDPLLLLPLPCAAAAWCVQRCCRVCTGRGPTCASLNEYDRTEVLRAIFPPLAMLQCSSMESQPPYMLHDQTKRWWHS